MLNSTHLKDTQQLKDLPQNKFKTRSKTRTILLVVKTNFKQVQVYRLFLSQMTVQMWPQQEYTEMCEPM